MNVLLTSIFVKGYFVTLKRINLYFFLNCFYRRNRSPRQLADNALSEKDLRPTPHALRSTVFK